MHSTNNNNLILFLKSTIRVFEASQGQQEEEKRREEKKKNLSSTQETIWIISREIDRQRSDKIHSRTRSNDTWPRVAKIIRKLVLTLPWQMSNLDLAPIKCTQNAVVKARTHQLCLATAELCILIELKNFPARFTFQLLSLGLVPNATRFPL